MMCGGKAAKRCYSAWETYSSDSSESDDDSDDDDD
jgi:hypothetical protein